MNIVNIIQAQREYFSSKKTLDIATRKIYLKKLYKEIKAREILVTQALKADLGKSYFESYMCEFGFILASLKHTIKHLKKWGAAKAVSTPITHFHSKSYIVQEPYGLSLVISPWNYPFMLALEPLFSAVAAGNCCILKPSELSPNTSLAIKEIIEAVFPKEYVACVLGDVETSKALLAERFDYIFFTGSVSVAKYVMEMAAKNLTPLTLELGGKSPCIIEKSADIKIAARRIAFGKFLNAGQTCIAPDYLLLDSSIKQEFLSELKAQIEKMYGKNPLENEDYVHIINKRHFERACALIDDEKVILGGKSDVNSLKIAPTILDEVSLDDAVMKEEIFAPILPVISFSTMQEAKDIIKTFEKPLALYLFTKNKKVERDIVESVSFGGGCINNTIMHVATQNLPFGGVGNSGIGAYHGEDSFKTFSHAKSILKTYNWIDLPIKYQPYKKIYEKIIKFLIH